MCSHIVCASLLYPGSRTSICNKKSEIPKPKQVKLKTTIMSDVGTIDNSLWRDLPPEMVAHVLSLLPVKSLCRFKCVSPSWNSLISSPHFAKTHLHITDTSNKPKKYILIPWKISNALYSIDFGTANPTVEKVDFPLIGNPDRGLQFSGSCNGLVLVYDKGGISNFLLNPSTRECKKLPESPFFDISSSARIKLYPIGCHVFLAGLGYVSSTDDYKVVMLLYLGYSDSESDFDGDVNGITEVTVYSLKTDSWRRIQDCHYTPVDFRRAFCFNERLHWLSWRTGDYGPYGSMVVVAFNLSDEIFREVHLPATFDDYEVEYHDMAVLRSCLCLVIWSFSNKVDVWMMKKYGVRESWIKFTIANHGMPQRNLLYLSAEDEVVLRTYGCDVHLVVYDPKKEALGDMLVHGLPTKFIEGGNYIETLFSPNHGGSVFR